MSENRKVYKMSDDLIGMVREIIQLSLLTGTNIVDHLRSIQMEPVEGKEVYLTVTPEYVEAYNKMVLSLNEQALKMQEEMQKTAAVDEG